jgi:hypothetical protein
MQILVETDMKVGRKEQFTELGKKRPTTFDFSFLNCKRKCKERSPHGMTESA